MSHQWVSRVAALSVLAIAAGCVAVPAGTLKNLQSGSETVVAGRTASVGITSLTGTMLGPMPGLISDKGAAVISNNSGGLISNNGGGIISNNSGGYRVLHVADLVSPAANVELSVVDLAGRTLTTKPAKTDKDGHFKLTGLRPAAGVVLVKATYTLEGQTVTLLAPVAVAATIQNVTVDPATSLVAKKLLEDLASGAQRAEALRADTLDATAKAIAAAMSDRAVVAATILPQAKAAETYDHMLEESPELAKAVGEAEQMGPTKSEATPASAAPGDTDSLAPSTAPGASVQPSKAPSGTSSAAPSAAPSTATSVAPSPSPSPLRLNGGVVGTFAGSGTAGATNGTGTAADFNEPVGLCWDKDGSLLVADQNNHMIRRITAAGVVTTVAGTGAAGAKNTTALASTFRHPEGIAVDAAGTLFVADRDNHRIRKIDTAGNVTTFAGSSLGFTEGKGTAAAFNEPTSMVFDATGTLIVCDSHNHCLRKIAPDGTVSTWVGSGTAGRDDGVGRAASFNHPTSICMDKNGVIYAVEEVSGSVRKILPDGTVSTLPGTFNMPTGVAVDANGLVYIAEQNGNTIRTIALNSGAAVLAGSGAWGFKDATGSGAQFDTPHGLLLDAQNRLYVADMDNHRIRRVE